MVITPGLSSGAHMETFDPTLRAKARQKLRPSEEPPAPVASPVDPLGAIKGERKQLSEERMAVEDRLTYLRSLDASKAKAKLQDESFEDIFELAMQMKEASVARVDDFKGRIDEVKEERKWVDSTPDTELWRDVQRRMKVGIYIFFIQITLYLLRSYNC